MAVTLQTKTQTSSWTSVFPTETIQSQAQSLAFMKKFTAVGVSNILYLRSDLPDDTFVTQNIDGLRVTMLKNSSHPVANEICQSVKNAVRALKDGFLKELHVVFYPGPESNEIVEMYKFSFELPEEKNKLPGHQGDSDDIKQSSDLIKKSTRQLLRAMSNYIQTCETLPATAQMGFRLIYNDNAPVGYNPPGFVSLSPNSLKTKFLDTPSDPITCGSIASNWHRVDVTMQSTLFDKTISLSQESKMSKASKASLLPKPPKGYHNEDKFVSPIIRTQKTPNHTQNETQISAIDEGDEEDETMLESSQLDVPRSSKAKKKTAECVLSLSPSGLDQIDSNIQMDELADQTSTLDITQSSSAKKRKTYVGNTPANKKGNSTKPNPSGQLKKRNTTSNTPGKIKKRSPLKVTLKKKSKVGSKQTKRFNI